MAVETEIYSNPQQALEMYRITEKEVKAIKIYASEAYNHIEHFVDDFYTWLPIIPEFKFLFSRASLLAQVKKKQAVYWREFFTCDLNEEYIQSRFKVGDVHATIRLPLSSYIAAMSFSNDWWIAKIGEKKCLSKKQLF